MSSDTELEARDIRAGYISWCRGELPAVLAGEKFDRFIAKVKADALLEWARFQESALEASHHALDQDELNTTLAWIDDAKAYALRIEGKHE